MNHPLYRVLCVRIPPDCDEMNRSVPNEPRGDAVDANLDGPLRIYLDRATEIVSEQLKRHFIPAV